MSTEEKKLEHELSLFPQTVARGVGQVMFQDNYWTGLLFLCGIFWGAYSEGLGIVAWGALIGVLVSTITGYILKLPDEHGSNGLWGFNGILVGCAFPTFLANTVWMWLGLIICAMMSTFVRSGLNKIMGRWNISSLTFPFVLCTWVFLLSARLLEGFPAANMGTPEFAHGDHTFLSLAFGDLVLYWLREYRRCF